MSAVRDAERLVLRFAREYAIAGETMAEDKDGMAARMWAGARMRLAADALGKADRAAVAREEIKNDERG